MQLPAGSSLKLPRLAAELAAYTVEGDVQIDGESIASGTFAVLEPGRESVLQAGTSAVRLMVLGGDALPERRFMWWNFVSSSRERIVQASADWEAGKFPAVAGETEFIPLPEHKFG